MFKFVDPNIVLWNTQHKENKIPYETSSKINCKKMKKKYHSRRKIVTKKWWLQNIDINHYPVLAKENIYKTRSKTFLKDNFNICTGSCLKDKFVERKCFFEHISHESTDGLCQLCSGNLKVLFLLTGKNGENLTANVEIFCSNDFCAANKHNLCYYCLHKLYHAKKQTHDCTVNQEFCRKSWLEKAENGKNTGRPFQVREGMITKNDGGLIEFMLY